MIHAPTEILPKHKLQQAYDAWLTHYPACQYTFDQWAWARKTIIEAFCRGFKSNQTTK